MAIGGAYFAATACRGPTEISLVISTDVDCTDLRGTAVAIGTVDGVEEKTPVTSSTLCDASGSIGTLVVVPSGGRSAEVGIRVVAGIGREAEACVPPTYAGCIVARRSIRFVVSTPLRLPVALRIDCRDVPCDATHTCVNGVCVPSRIPDPAACVSGCDESSLPSPDDAGAPLDASMVDAADDGMSPVRPPRDAGDADAAPAGCATNAECGANAECVQTTNGMPTIQRCRTNCNHDQDCTPPQMCVILNDPGGTNHSVCSEPWGPNTFGQSVPSVDQSNCQSNVVHQTNGTDLRCSRLCVTSADCAAPLPTCKVLVPPFSSCGL
jgi:hypothetical protein